MKKRVYLKYFWDLNDKAAAELEDVFKNPDHPKFNTRVANLLSRCQKPKELFSFIDKNSFIEFWPKVRKHWQRLSNASDFIDWWQTVYEQLLADRGIGRPKKVPGKEPFLRSIGAKIRESRVDKGLTQKELALCVGMKQPDISKIEEGKVNITLLTLLSLGQALDIKEIELTNKRGGDG